jgi:hypothetical protein
MAQAQMVEESTPEVDEIPPLKVTVNLLLCEDCRMTGNRSTVDEPMGEFLMAFSFEGTDEADVLCRPCVQRRLGYPAYQPVGARVVDRQNPPRVALIC